jgi:hypothetical protein
MAPEFVEHFGGLDAAGGRLPPPLMDRLFEIKLPLAPARLYPSSALSIRALPRAAISR